MSDKPTLDEWMAQAWPLIDSGARVKYFRVSDSLARRFYSKLQNDFARTADSHTWADVLAGRVHMHYMGIPLKIEPKTDA